MSSSPFDSGVLVTSAQRNAEMQIQNRARASQPAVQKQMAEEDRWHRLEIFHGQLIAFGNMHNSRCRAAGNPWPLASAKAAAIVADFEKTTTGLWDSALALAKLGDNSGLVKIAEHIKEVENGLPAVLQEISDIARTEQAEANREARQRREMGWMAEARKLDANGVIKALEVYGARLVLRDGQIGIKGAAADERTRIFVAAHKAEIERLLVERETVTLIGEPEHG